MEYIGLHLRYVDGFSDPLINYHNKQGPGLNNFRLALVISL